jgi:hypothetical protein
MEEVEKSPPIRRNELELCNDNQARQVWENQNYLVLPRLTLLWTRHVRRIIVLISAVVSNSSISPPKTPTHLIV